MTSRVSWSVDGVEPSVRERAEAAARRAGMPLNEWLNATLGATAGNADAGQEHDAHRGLPDKDAQDVAEIHARLNSITRQIEKISQDAAPARGNSPVGQQLNDAISRLDARLARISEPPPAPPPRQEFAPPQSAPSDQNSRIDSVQRAAAQVYHTSPSISPLSLDAAIAEIAARQSELDNRPVRNLPQWGAPSMTAPDFSGLERQLLHITGQIESLRQPGGIEQSIAAFRNELGEIRQAITEAMPRRAIESLENEIRSLARKIEETRQNGTDDKVLTGIERALGEIYEALRTLTPAEHLAGFDDAIRSLGGKIDAIVRSSEDPGTLRQLEDAISAMRVIVSNVASNDALARLSDDIHTLSSKLDQLGRPEGHGDSFAVLEQRIAMLTSALESHGRQPIGDTAQLDGALRALSDRIDNLQVGSGGASTFSHVEQRISHLLERLEMSETRSPNLGRVEDALSDILRHLEHQRVAFSALNDPGARAAPEMDPGLVDTIKRELSDMRFSQSETTRHTQDSLEVVHNTLGHVVDRLAMIEGDLRKQIHVAAPVPPLQVSAPSAPLPPRPELPNPARAQESALRTIAAAPMQDAPFSAAPAIPNAISAILAPKTAADDRAPVSQTAVRPPQALRPPINPDLPPDHPLEPGSRIASPSERIAASEVALGEISPAAREQANPTNFIAAARRAAQAATAATAAAPAKTGRVTALADAARAAVTRPAASGQSQSTMSAKIRALLVGVSVVVIVLGTFRMAMTLLDSGETDAPIAGKSSDAAPSPVAPAESSAKPAAPAAPPSVMSPTPIDRQSLNAPAAKPAEAPPVQVSSAAASDVTGSVSASKTNAAANTAAPILHIPENFPVVAALAPAGDRLPDAIGGPALRAAALKGDPAAAYEIGLRFAEGKGVATNYDEAAKWYDRSAQKGIVPAMFRLGTLYEKGLGLKKDIDAARRYYLQAAERGSAKAMHNLAVLDADGGAKGPNYKGASQWFRKAADHGVADSQFNLGILYARGIGVEQNLAESFKWFSLAAAQGDADAGRKREDVAKRLDAQSLAAAKLAIQTFTPESQPDDAVTVAAPTGGWDGTPAAPKRPAKQAAAQRAAR